MAEKINFDAGKEDLSELKKSIVREVLATISENGIILGGMEKGSGYRAMRKFRRECEAVLRR